MMPRSSSKPSFEDVLAEFTKVAHQTPAERARERVLEKHDLSEEEYHNLPPEKRAAIDEEIARAVRLAMTQPAADQAGKRRVLDI